MQLILGLLLQLIYIYGYLIIIYILMSWFPGARESQFGYFLGRIVEPFLEPFRRIIPPIGGMIDISPIVALLVLRFLVPRGLIEIFSMLESFLG
ncbi:MAG TPA: YggT family protein [Pseudogracilibacillus sp.]|nr:YggT family protein [Pseudogracilibacillus sp.]